MALTPLEKEIFLAETARSKFLDSKLRDSALAKNQQSHIDFLEKRIYDYEHSLSWKITLPLRLALKSLKSAISRLKIGKASGYAGTVPITAIITTFNQSAQEIQTAVNSILLQTWTKFRLIIWDDGSSHQETLDFLRSLDDSTERRLSVHFMQNQGVVGARNSAAALADSKYILFLDPDDYIDLTYFEKSLLLAESHPQDSVAVVQSDVYVKGHPEIEYWRTEELSWPGITNYNQVPICSLIKRSSFNEVSGFSPQMKNGFEDWDLWVRLALKGYKSLRISEPLFTYTYEDSAGRYSFLKEKIQLNQIGIKVSAAQMPIQKLPLPEFHQVPYGILDHTLSIYNTEKTTVFIFVPWLATTGGAETFLKTLAEALVENGRTVCFVSTLYNHESPSVRDYLDVTPYVYDLPKFVNERSSVDFVANLISRCPEAIILNSGSEWLYENIEILKSKSHTSIRAYDVLYNPIGHLPNFLINQNHFMGVIPVYDNLATILTDYFQVEPEVKKISVGIQSLPLSASEMKSRQKIGWVGRLSSEKRPDWFVQLAANSTHDVNFELAGVGPMKVELENMISKQHYEGARFSMVGYVDSATDYIASLDLLVNTSMIEGIAVTAMEAISQGIPVLAPRVGGMSELIEDGVNGYLFDPDDFKDLCAKLTKIFSEPNELSRLKESTRATRLPSTFSSVEMIASFENLFSSKN